MCKNGKLLLTAFFLCSVIVRCQYRLVSNQEIDLSMQHSTISASHLSIVKEIPTIGFQNVVANWYFIQFLQYFGDSSARHQTGYSHSAEYLSTAIHQDPYFRPLYVFLSGSSTAYAGDPESTVKVMSAGLQKIAGRPAPDSYYIWRYKATDELLFLGDSQAAQKSFSLAAEWAAQSDHPDADTIGQLSHNTATFLANNPNSRAAQIDAWGSLLTTALDEKTRDRAVKRIESLGGSVVTSESGEISIRYEQVENPDSDNSSEI